MIRSAVVMQITRVTDGQSDGRTDGIAVAHIRAIAYYAVARKNREKDIFRAKIM